MLDYLDQDVIDVIQDLDLISYIYFIFINKLKIIND